MHIHDIAYPARAGLGQKIGPGIFLVQAAHQHFELYIYIQEEHVPAR